MMIMKNTEKVVLYSNHMMNDDYISIWNIDNWLHFLYKRNPEYDDDNIDDDEPYLLKILVLEKMKSYFIMILER